MLDRWTEEENRQIIRLRSEGQSAKEIALALGRPYLSARSQIHVLMQAGRIQKMTSAEREIRTIKSRERRTAKLQSRAAALVSQLPNTKDMGYVIGVIYGDGFVNFKDIAKGIPKSIGLSTVNLSFCNAFAKALGAWCGDDAVKRTEHQVNEVSAPGGHKYQNVHYYNAWLHQRYVVIELLKHTGPTQTDCWSVNLEDAQERGPEFCDGIIQGLFDSDGSFSMPSLTGASMAITFGTASPTGADSFCNLLTLRGYAFHRNLSLRPDRKPFYTLAIQTAESRIRFAQEINSRIDYKAERLAEYLRRIGMR